MRYLIPLALALLGGCASAPPPKAVLPGKDSCVFKANVSSWEVLDDQSLLVQAPFGHYYLFKLFAPLRA
jgi:hypothetical protein